MSKKITIIIGTSSIILILFFGILAYYQEEKHKTISWFDTSPESQCENFLDDNQYVVCCVKNEKFYDCTKREEFKTEEEIEIVVDPTKIKNIPEDFDYACLVTDIWRKQLDNSFIFFPEDCFYYKKDQYLWKVRGITPKGYGIFTLLKANVYPDHDMNIWVVEKNQEGIAQGSKQLTVLNLEAKI